MRIIIVTIKELPSGDMDVRVLGTKSDDSQMPTVLETQCALFLGPVIAKAIEEEGAIVLNKSNRRDLS